MTDKTPTVPETINTALIKLKSAQGTGGCIAFKRGAEWFRDIALAAAQAKGGE